MPKVQLEVSPETLVMLKAYHEARFGPNTTNGDFEGMDDVVADGLMSQVDALPKPTYDRYKAHLRKEGLA